MSLVIRTPARPESSSKVQPVNSVRIELLLHTLSFQRCSEGEGRHVTVLKPFPTADTSDTLVFQGESGFQQDRHHTCIKFFKSEDRPRKANLTKSDLCPFKRHKDHFSLTESLMFYFKNVP